MDIRLNILNFKDVNINIHDDTLTYMLLHYLLTYYVIILI